MVKKRHLLPATSTPIRASASGEMTSSRGVWSPWIDSVSGHVIQQTGRRADLEVGQLTDVTSSRGFVTSFPVNNRQQSSRLWSPYLDLTIGELLILAHSLG